MRSVFATPTRAAFAKVPWLLGIEGNWRFNGSFSPRPLKHKRRITVGMA